jgi:hypothetical protein
VVGVMWLSCRSVNSADAQSLTRAMPAALEGVAPRRRPVGPGCAATYTRDAPGLGAREGSAAKRPHSAERFARHKFAAQRNRDARQCERDRFVAPQTPSQVWAGRSFTDDLVRNPLGVVR